jgi:uncharacterized membrane protein
MNALASLIDTVFTIYIFLLLASVISSWLVSFNVLNTQNQFIYSLLGFLYRITEPALRQIRRIAYWCVMTGTLWSLALALAIFIAVHMVPVVPGLRAALINAWGNRVYRALFSILSLADLVWIVFAHMDAPYIVLWDAPDWSRLIPLAAMPLVMILLATMPTEGIKKVTRHPLLWAIILWATAHILPNGDAASLMLFGVFALYALIDQPLADARTRREEPESWVKRSAESSALPFLAALQGRARPSLKEIGYPRIAPALVLYVVILFAHEHVVGLSPMPL